MSGPTLPDWSAGTGAVAPHGGNAPAVRWTGREGPPPAAVVVVHGRGGSADGILELADHVGVGDSRSAGILWVAPQAQGHTWYPNSFLAPVNQNEPGRTSGLDVLGRIVGDLEALGVPRARIAVGGFSQGACLALEFAANLAKPIGVVFALSGGLIGAPGQLGEYQGALSGVPVFMGCSDVDPHIPVERVRESAEVAAALGARVDVRIYPGMGHTVNRDELDAVSGLLKTLVTREAPGRDGDGGPDS